MTYTHLTTNELVMIEAYYQEGMAVSAICHSLERSKQTIYKLIAYFKAGHTAYDYYKNYKASKQHCGRRKTQLTQSEQTFIQMHLDRDWSLDVVKGTYPDKISCSMRTLYRLVDRGTSRKRIYPGRESASQMVRQKNMASKLFVGIFVSVRKSIQNVIVSLVILKVILLLVKTTKGLNTLLLRTSILTFGGFEK